MVERTGDGVMPWNRDLNTREAEELYSHDYRPPTNLPTPDPQEGYVFRWVRSSLLGEADNRNVSMRFREGWEPVKKEDHPELMVTSDRGSTFDDGIEIGGLILCKTSVEHMDRRLKYYHELARRQEESVDQNFMRQNDPRMPLLPIEKQHSVTFGRGRPS